MRKLLAVAFGALLLVGASADHAFAQKKPVIALIPGLTTDAFYITMRKGAEMAAKARRLRAPVPGRAGIQPDPQVPVLQAVIARQPDAILIAPDRQAAADRTPAAGGRRRHPGDHRRHLHRRRQVPGRQRRRATSRCPTSPPTTCSAAFSAAWRWPRQVDGKGKVYVSNVKPGHQTTDQREEGFKLAMQELSRTSPCSRPSSTTTTPTRRRRRCRRCSPAMPTSPACSAPTCSRRSAPPTASRRWARPARSGWSRSTRRQRIVDDLKSGLIDLAVAQHPAEIGYYGVMTAYRRDQRPVGAAADRHRRHDHDKDNIDDPEVRKFVY